MSGVEPEKNGMEQLLESVQGSFRNFLNGTVGADTGKQMLSSVYGETRPATTEERVNWSGVVFDEDGQDTGMHVQVWNGNGSAEETQMCSDIAMILHGLSERRAARGAEVSSSDIHTAIVDYFSRTNPTAVTATELTKTCEMLRRIGQSDIEIPPANYSGPADEFIRRELLYLSALNPDSSRSRLTRAYLKCKLAGENVISELDKSIAEDILAEHPDILDLPMDYLLPVKFHTLMKSYYPDMTDEQIKTVMEIFDIRDPKATEQ